MGEKRVVSKNYFNRFGMVLKALVQTEEDLLKIKTEDFDQYKANSLHTASLS